MKKIILFVSFFMLFSQNILAEEIIWDVKDVDFWTEIEEENKKFEEEKNYKLDAQIELDLNEENYEIDLIDAIETGIQNSNSYKIAKYKKEYSDWEFRNKLSEFLPDINYSLTLQKYSGEFLVGGILPRVVSETIYSSNFNFTWNPLNNGKTIFESIRLKNQQKAQKFSENYTKEELIYNISSAYYELLKTKFNIEVYRYNLVELEEQLKYNRAVYDIGIGTKFDILRAQSELENGQAKLQSAILSLKMAQVNLANIAGYPIFANLQPKEKRIHKLELVDNTKTPDVLFAEALLLRNDIKAKEKNINALKYKRKSDICDFMPNVAFTWQSSFVGTIATQGRRNDTFGMMVTVPFGKNLGVNTLTKYKMDNMNVLIGEAELNQLKKNIQSSITNNYYGIKTNQDIILSKNKEVISTQEGLRQAIGRLRVGEASYLDVLEANRLKTQARTDLIQAIVDYNKNQLKQMFDVGNINITDIQINYEKAKKLFE